MADEKATIIDAQAEFEGKLKGRDAVILGRFRGEVGVSGRLVVGEGSHVEATVVADVVEVTGELKGDLRARSVVLGEKARVQGTVDARVLVVREGAWLNGSVSAGEPPKPTAAPAEPRPVIAPVAVPNPAPAAAPGPGTKVGEKTEGPDKAGA
jgi:cytoskeletal protein CcmA (bactofilin family)